MKTVTLKFAENVYHRPNEEKLILRVHSGKERDAVNLAFDTFAIVANKFVADLDKAGFKGATIDTAQIGGAYGGLSVSALIRVPRNPNDSHEVFKTLKAMFPDFEKWANENR